MKVEDKIEQYLGEGIFGKLTNMAAMLAPASMSASIAENWTETIKKARSMDMEDILVKALNKSGIKCDSLDDIKKSDIDRAAVAMSEIYMKALKG